MEIEILKKRNKIILTADIRMKREKTEKLRTKKINEVNEIFQKKS